MGVARRREIRQKIVEILKDKTSAGSLVLSNPSSPTWEGDLPVILVRTLTETSEMYAQSPREYQRTLQLLIEVIVEGPEDDLTSDGSEELIDGMLDALILEVEIALFADDTLGDTASDIMPLSAEFDFIGEGERPIAAARMIYSVIYYELLPESLESFPRIGEFKQANVDWKVGHHDEEPDDQIEAKDEVVIPQT